MRLLVIIVKSSTEFCLDYKLYLPLKTFELATLGACLVEWNSRNCLLSTVTGKDRNLEGSSCALKASRSEGKSRGILAL